MKLNFGKRLVLFLHWLLSLAACVLAVGYCVWPDFVLRCFEALYTLTGKGAADIAGAVILAVYVIMAVLSVSFIFSRKNRKKDHGFITVDSSESGRTRIAIGAVEQMIRQAVRGVDGITDMKASIQCLEDSISIDVSVAISAGAHVPTVTMNIQRAIRSYIELNCGVAVREVCVSVHTLENAAENGKHGKRKAAPAAVMPAAPAEIKSAEGEIRATIGAFDRKVEETPVQTADIPETIPVEPAPVDEPIIADADEEPAPVDAE